jgi:2-desacetyl-2-hydroxyethyl bacteriochlorophyllide A dehydrogenase
VEIVAMKAMLLTAHGDTSGLVLGEVRTPSPGPGDALVRVEATGVNHMDLLVRRGYPGIPVTLPHIMGGDVVGRVAALGAGATGVREGDRVVAAPVVGCGRCVLCSGGQAHLCLDWQYLGLHRAGGYAEYAIVPVENLVPVSSALDAAAVAALPVAGLTAFHALRGVADLRDGQTLFLWGGAGTVGTLAIQIAKDLGARTIVTASSEERRALAVRLGAELAVDPRDPTLEEKVRSLAPAGADVVLDSVGAETFPRSFALVRKGGQLLICGMIGGRDVPLNIHQTYLRHLSIRGLYLGSRQELAELVDLVESGRVVPHVGARLPLERAASGHDLLARRANLGKIALMNAPLARS